jgi:hypothetical protein
MMGKFPLTQHEEHTQTSRIYLSDIAFDEGNI